MDETHSFQLGRDYIVEDGKYVFTSGYLLQRGYCCHNGCRNCPYDNPPGNRPGHGLPGSGA